jgi:hypothetical protein
MGQNSQSKAIWLFWGLFRSIWVSSPQLLSVSTHLLLLLPKLSNVLHRNGSEKNLV